MTELIAGALDSTQLLFDLQRASEIVQQFSGCTSAADIACRATDGLVEQFGCAFARIWLIEPSRNSLKLVASSGLYTRTDGSFARVPMGAYKVGKIAQNRVSFLSNNLAEESWVKDRDWAIANRIRGFAGFPLTVQNPRDGLVRDQVIGVLAAFSHKALSPEFLEVLQVLCTMVSVALEAALRHEHDSPRNAMLGAGWHQLTLSDQLVALLDPVRLTLIGKEQPLSLAQTCLFLQVAESFKRLGCRSCRLSYRDDGVELDAVTPSLDVMRETPDDWLGSECGLLSLTATCLGGRLQKRAIANQQGLQLSLQLPYETAQLAHQLEIRCQRPVLQLAFTHLASAAGILVGPGSGVPLLTDDVIHVKPGQAVLWIAQPQTLPPPGVSACIDLNTTPEQLRDALSSVLDGKSWGVSAIPSVPTLSEREREILQLLASGLRDRDIANELIISESTVKFHLNNVLSKLKARTRFQALYMAVQLGLL